MRVKYGIAVEGLNGSAGGTTASRNKSREYFKIRTAPRNPRTVDQSVARGRLAGISKSWGALTEAQRTQWDEFAKTQKGRRVLGVAGVLSGFNAFSRIGLNLALLDKPALLNPPTSTVIPELIESVVEITAAGVISIGAKAIVPTIDGGENVFTFGYQLVVEMTPILPDGRASDKSALRVIAIGAQGQSSVAPGGIMDIRAVEVSDLFTAKYGSKLAPGDKVQIALKAIGVDAGYFGVSTLKLYDTVIIPNLPAGE